MLSLSILVLIIAVILGLFAQQQQTPPPFSSRPCSNDPPVTIESFAIDPCHVFSESYVEAREKFRTAATTAGAELHALEVKVPDEQSMSKDYVYTMDVAVLPGSGPGLVVHTSGVHGVEGYAGSPIQIAFLENFSKQQHQKQLSPTVVLVHAFNPYGMAHHRRTNENNVDLNRNGLHPEQWKETNMKGPTGIYQAYGQFDSFFNPKGPPNWLHAFVSLWAQAGKGLALNGFDALKAAMVTGQYYDKSGIFFGGQELQPSYQLLWEFLQTNLLVVEETATTTEGDEVVEEQPKKGCCTGPVTWIDVHTGLGPSGVDSILFDDQTMKTRQDFVHGQMEKWFPGAQTPQMSESAKKVAKGYDKAKGFAPEFFQRLWDDREEQYLGMVQEFGTIHGFLVAHALILENRAFHHLPTKDALGWSQQTTKRAFYKQTTEWRRQILERGTQLLLQAIERSSSK